MTKVAKDPFPIGDPYTASSLLQKAIRRGERELAQEAAWLLARHRGRNAWRRLIVIACEDVGLGNFDAAARVVEVARGHFTHSANRLTDGLEEAVATLATSDKSRSADHLYCSAIRAVQARTLARRAQSSSVGEMLSITGDPSRPLIERAAALLDCQGRGEVQTRRTLSERMVALRGCLSTRAGRWIDLSLEAFAVLNDPFVLTLPLLQSALEESPKGQVVEVDQPPPFEWIGRLPSYVFDKHTAVGKKALTRLAHANSSVSQTLDQYVAPAHWTSAICMAGFYVDAVSLDQKLTWHGSAELERQGLIADMHKAGCPACGIDPLIEIVADNIDHLNALRVELSGWRAD